MRPVVTPQEMADIDQAAPEPVEELIGRAGGAVARSALVMLAGGYAKRIVVIAGGGNNGNDGREAARRLRLRGAHVEVVDPDVSAIDGPVDLVIDAAFGTGFRGSWRAPSIPEQVPVLAVDIPSGVEGLTGTVAEDTTVLRAERTVTFAALKPGLVLGDGPGYAGTVELADIGLDVSGARIWALDDHDVHTWLPGRHPDTHKWRSAVWVIGASPGMAGALALTCAGAQRAGAGYVRASTPGGLPGSGTPIEAVQVGLDDTGWWPRVRRDLDRFGALVIGNGLGRRDELADDVRSVVAAAPCPVVVDADALGMLGDDVARVVADHVVLTPHDGEFATLTGSAPGPDRIASAREFAGSCGAIVVLKGPCTVVAHPDGRVLLVDRGDERLATAGTGDVLAGMIGALCARGLDPWRAAGAAAHLHGAAAALGWPDGLVASDLPDLIPRARAGLGRAAR